MYPDNDNCLVISRLGEVSRVDDAFDRRKRVDDVKLAAQPMVDGVLGSSFIFTLSCMNHFGHCASVA